MTFKIGDKVKVREDLKYGMIVGSYERNSVVKDMLQYAGKTATITDIDDNACYLDIDGEEWVWGDIVLDKLSDIRPVDQVIEELKAERDAIKAKNKKAGQMIARGGLDQEQNYLLAAQKQGYDTVCHILDIRIRSLKKQLPAPEPEPKKYNVKVLGRDDVYYWKSATGNLRFADSIGNDDSNQQFTMAEIEKYGLGICSRDEVKN